MTIQFLGKPIHLRRDLTLEQSGRTFVIGNSIIGEDFTLDITAQNLIILPDTVVEVKQITFYASRSFVTLGNLRSPSLNIGGKKIYLGGTSTHDENGAVVGYEESLELGDEQARQEVHRILHSITRPVLLLHPSLGCRLNSSRVTKQ